MMGFRICHMLKPENSSPNWDSNPHSSIGDRLGKQMCKVNTSMMCKVNTSMMCKVNTSMMCKVNTSICKVNTSMCKVNTSMCKVNTSMIWWHNVHFQCGKPKSHPQAKSYQFLKKINILVVAVPDVWWFGLSDRTGWPSVSTPWLRETFDL